MNAFALSRLVHILVAVGALGCILATLVVVRTERPLPTATIVRLNRFSRVAIGLMIASGIAMDGAAHGMFHQQGWFRAGALFSIVLAVVLVLAGRAARIADEAAARARLSRLSMTGCALLLTITALMEIRPW